MSTGNPKLTPQEVTQIRLMWEQKVWDGYEVTIPRLAEWFFVGKTEIKQIVEQKTWKNLRCD